MISANRKRLTRLALSLFTSFIGALVISVFAWAESADPQKFSFDIQDDSLPRKLFDPATFISSGGYSGTLAKSQANGRPVIKAAEHTIGNLRLTRTNFGQFQLAQFPKTTGETYMTVGGLWIGAVVGRDTLVTTGVDDQGITEMWPNEVDTIVRRSININDRYYHPNAISEQDLTSVFYDTLTSVFFVNQDPVDGRVHIPLNIKITERSYQWSYDYAQDFILFDYEIQNLGRKTLEDVYIGIYIDGDTYYLSSKRSVALVDGNTVSGSIHDDLAARLETYPAECGFVDTLNVAYVMDNDGDPSSPGKWSTLYSLRGVSGVRVLRTPNGADSIGFNWWITGPSTWDFGPRKSSTDDEPFRDMNGFLGTPYGDKNKYNVMRLGEVDYDQIQMLLDHQAEGWLPPPRNAAIQSGGGNVRYLVSVGPTSIQAGQSVPLTFAYVAGLNLHQDPGAYHNNFDPYEPDKFLSALDYSGFALNARWASWIYDNPGIDTDNNGYRGKSRKCVLGDTAIIETTLFIDSVIIPPETTLVIDTNTVPLAVDITYYEGDGTPDFLGASPPPAPIVRVIPEVGKLTIRWNGFVSETTPDPFSDKLDFEGYRVYMSFSERQSDYVLQTSYDHENFNRYIYDSFRNNFILKDDPFTLAQLQALYGSSFDPANYGIDNPLVATNPLTGTDEVYYFTTMDWNRDAINEPGTIAKRFPSATKPSPDPDLWTDADLTEEGLPKFYEYEYILDDLLPSIPVYCSITAFDFGSPKVKLPSLETVPQFNAVREYPLLSSTEATARDLPVVVYPNPYRIDGNYRADGFEARGDNTITPDRARRINFINLPWVCKISIYSLDGDLVRDIIHDFPRGGPGSMHDSWDVISRNTQPVVSGIYYWIIEEPDGKTEMGKIIIIM